MIRQHGCLDHQMLYHYHVSKQYLPSTNILLVELFGIMLHTLTYDSLLNINKHIFNIILTHVLYIDCLCSQTLQET